MLCCCRRATMSTASAAAAAPGSLYDIPVRTIMGKEEPIGATIRGKVALVVNVASQCGLTGQYEGLEELQQRFAARGFTVVGFPCNQFGGQEPGTEAEISTFACSKYKATFPLFAKVDVNGAKEAPLYKHLKDAKGSWLGRDIKWNFAKVRGVISRARRGAARRGAARSRASVTTTTSRARDFPHLSRCCSSSSARTAPSSSATCPPPRRRQSSLTLRRRSREAHRRAGGGSSVSRSLEKLVW